MFVLKQEEYHITTLDMEQFVTHVRNKSSGSKFLELTDYLKRSNDLLRKNANHLTTVLETLDYNQHSLGVMAVSGLHVVKFKEETPKRLMRKVCSLLMVAVCSLGFKCKTPS